MLFIFLASDMNFLFYKLTLNLKWFLSTIVGCLIAAIWLVIPFSLNSVFFMIKTGDFSNDFVWKNLLLMVGMYAVGLWFVGRGLKKYHPPIEWSTNRNNAIHIIVNILLLLPFLYFTYTLLTTEYFPFFGSTAVLSQLLTFPSIFLLFLIHRKITNEDLEMAKQTSEREIEASPEEYQRRMRFTIIILAFSMLVSIFFVVYSHLKADHAIDLLDKERLWHARELEELNLKIDSLTIELEIFKMRNDSISNNR